MTKKPSAKTKQELLNMARDYENKAFVLEKRISVGFRNLAKEQMINEWRTKAAQLRAAAEKGE